MKLDYWGYFELCVKQLKISPRDAWSMDLVEIYHLSEIKPNQIDESYMLNFERKINGATAEWLQNHS